MHERTDRRERRRRPPGRRRETIQVGDEWLSRDEIADRIQEKMAAGNIRFKELADALDDIDARLMVKAENKLDEAIAYTEKNRGIFDDILPVETRMENAKEMLGKKEYELSLDESFEAIRLTNERRDERYSGEIADLLEEAEGIIRENQEMGVDVSGTEDLVSKCRAHLDKKEYEEALALGRSTKGLVVTSQKGQLKSKASDLLSLTMTSLVEAKTLELEVAEFEERLILVRESFEREEFKETIELADTLRLDIKDVLSRGLADVLHTYVKGLIDMMERAKEVGVDISGERKIAAGIDSIIKMQGYQAAIDTISAQAESLENRMKVHRRRTSTQRLRAASSELASFQKAEKMAFTDMQDYRDKAFDALEREDYDDLEAHLIKFAEAKIQHKLELKKNSYTTMIDERESEAKIISELRIAIDGIEESISKAKDSVSSNDFQRAESIITEIAGKIESVKNVEAKELCEEHFERNEGLLNKMESDGLDVAKQKDLSGKAMTHFGSMEYLEAYRIALKIERGLKRTGEKAEKNQVSRSLENVQGLMNKAVELWLDVGNLQGDLDEAGKIFEEGDVAGAREEAARIEGELNGLLVEKQKEIYQWRYEELIKASERAKERGLELEDEFSRVAIIEEMGAKGEYIDTIEMIKECKASIEERIISHEESIYERKFEKAEDELTAFEGETSRKFDDLSSLLDMISTSLDERDYEKFGSILGDFYNLLGKYGNEHYTEKYTREIDEIEGSLGQFATIGVEVSDTAPLITRAREQISEADFDTTRNVLTEINTIFTDIKENRARVLAREITAKMNRIFKRLMAAGMDLDVEKELFNDIIVEIKSKDFLKACRLAIRSKRLLEKRDTGHNLNQIETAVSDGNTMLSEMQDRKYLSPELVERTQAILEKIRGQVTERALVEAKKGVVTLAALEERIREDMKRSDEISQLLLSIEELKEETGKLALDIVEEEKILVETEDYLDQYLLDDALPLLKEVQESLKSKVSIKMERECTTKLDRARKLLEGNRDVLEDWDEIGAKLAETDHHFESGEYERCIEIADEVIQRIEGFKENQVVNEIRDILKSSRKLTEETRDKGGDTARLEAIYYKATYFLEKNDFEKAGKYAKMALNDALKSRMAIDQGSAGKTLEKLVALKEKAVENGYESARMEEIVSEGRDHFEKGDFEKLEELVPRAEEEYTSVEVLKSVTDAEELAVKGAELWLDVDEIQKNLDDARAYYQDGDYYKVRGIVAEAINELEAMISSSFKEKMENLGKKLIVLLKRSKELGVDSSKETKLLMNIKSLKENGRYEEATGLLKEAMDSIAVKNNSKDMLLAQEELKSIESISGKEFNDLRELLNDGAEALEKDNGKILENILVNFRERAGTYRTDLSSKQYDGRLKGIEDEIKDFEDVGIDVSTAAQLIINMREALCENRQEDLEGDLDELKAMMNEMRAVTVKDLAWERFQQAEEMLEDMVARGIDVREGRKLFREARRAIRQDSYVKSIRSANEVHNFCKGLMEESESERLTGIIEHAREFSSELAQNKHFPKDVRKEMEGILDDAEDDLDDGKLGEAETIIEEYNEMETKAKEILERIERALAKIEELNGLLGEASAEGIDVNDDREDIDEAMSLLSESRLEDLFSLLEEVRDSLDEKIEAGKKEKARTSLEEAEAAFAKHSDMLKDPESVENRLSEVGRLMENKAYDRALELSMELKSDVEKGREKTQKEGIEGALENLWEFIQENDKLGIDMGRAEGLFYKAKYYTEKTDFENAKLSMEAAMTKAREGRSAYEKKNAASVMEELEGRIAEEARLELDIEGIERSRQEAAALFEDGDYAGSWKLVDETGDQFEKIVETKYLGLIEEGTGALKALIGKGRDLEADMGEDEDRLSEIDDARDEKSFRRALTLIVEIRASAQDRIAARLREINTQKLQDAVEELETFQGVAGKEYPDLRGFLDSAEEAFGSADYDKLDGHISEFREGKEEHYMVYLTEKYTQRGDELGDEIEFLENLGIEMNAAKDLAEELRETVENREFEDAEDIVTEIESDLNTARKVRAKETARELITATNKSFTEMKRLGVDVKKENEIFKEVLAATRARDYVHGIQLTLEAREGLARARGVYYREKASESIHLLEEQLDEGGELGIDVEAEEGSHAEAMELFDREKYEEALELSEKGRSTYAVLRSEYYQEKATNAMETVNELLDEAGELSIDLDDHERKKKDVERESGMERFEEALHRAEEVAEALRGAIENRLLEEIEEKTMDLASLMGTAQGLGVILEDEKDSLGAIDELKDRKEYRGIIGLLERCNGSVDEKIEVKLREINTRKFQELKDDLDRFEEETDSRYDDLHSFVEQAREALEAEDYSALDSHMEEFRGTREEHYRAYRAEDYGKRTDELEKNIREIEELNIDLAEANELVAELKRGIAAFEFQGLDEIITNIEEMIDAASNVQAKELAKTHFLSAKRLLEELREAGQEITEENGVFKEAVTAIKEKDFVSGCRLTRKAEEMLRSVQRGYYERLANGALKEAEEVIREAEEIGLDPTVIEDLRMNLGGCRQLIEEMEFLKAVDTAKTVITDYREKRDDHFRSIAGKKLDDIQEKIKEGFELELAMEPIVERLSGAESSFESADYEVAIELIDGTAGDLLEMRKLHFQTRTEEDLEELEGMVREGGELGLDLTDVGDILEEGNSLYEAEDYEAAIEVLREGKDDYSVIRQQHFRESTDSVVNEIKKMLGEAAEFGADMSSTKENVGIVRSLYDGEKYEESYERAVSSRDELRNIIDLKQSEILASEISELGADMERAGEIRADISEASERLLPLEGMRESGRFRECIELERDIRTSVTDRIEERLFEINTEKYEVASGLLSDLLDETGREYGELREKLAEAAKALEERDYEGLDLLSEQFRESRERERNLYLTDKYTTRVEALAEDVLVLADLGIAMGEAEGMIEETKRQIKELDFETIPDDLDELGDLIEKKRSEDAKNLAKEHFLSTKDLLEELKELDVEVVEHESTFKQGIAVVKERDFVKACHLLLEAKLGLNRAKETYYRETTEETLSEIEGLMNESMKLDMETGDFENRKNEINEVFDQADYIRSLDLAAALRDDMQRSVDEELVRIIGGREEELNVLFERAGKIEADVAEDRARQESTGHLMKEKQYYDVISAMDGIISAVTEKIEARLWDMNKTKFDEARENLSALEEETGKDYPDLHSLVEEAREILEEKNYDELSEVIIDFDNARNRHHGAYLTEVHTREIGKFEEEVSTIRGVGIELAEADELVLSGRRAVEEQRFGEVKTYLEKLEGVVKEAREVTAKQLAKVAFTSTNKLLTNLKRLGMDLHEEEAQFRQILTAIKARDFIESLKLTRSVSDNLNLAKKEHTKNKATEALTSLEGMLGDARSFLTDAVSLESLHGRAMEHFNGEDFDGALEFVGQARREYKEKRKAFLKELVTGSMDRIEKFMDDADELGIPTTEFDEAMDDVEIRFEKEEYGDAEEMAKKIISDLEDAIEKTLLGMMEARTQELAGLIKEAQEIEVETTQERERLSVLGGMKENGKYREIIALLDECADSVKIGISARSKEINREKYQKALTELSALEETTQRSYEDLDALLEDARRCLDEDNYRELDERIAEFEEAKQGHNNRYLAIEYGRKADLLDESIVEVEELGIDIPAARDMLVGMRGSIETHDFQEMDGTVSGIEELVEKIKIEDVKNLAREHFLKAKEILGELKELGMKLTEEEETFKEAIAAIKAREFVKGCRLTVQVEELLLNARERYYEDAAARELEDVGLLLGEAVELELETGELKENIDEAARMFEDGTFEEALDLARTSGDLLREMVNAKLRDILELEKGEIASKMEAARELDLDIQGDLDALMLSEEHVEAGRLRDAIDLIVESTAHLDGAIDIRTAELKAQDIEEARGQLASMTEETGTDYPDLLEFLEFATAALAESNYQDVDVELGKFEEIKNRYYNEFLAERYRQMLVQKGDEIETIRKVGIELLDIDEMVSQTAELIAAFDFERLNEVISRIDEMIENAKVVTARDSAKERIAGAKDIFGRLKTAGLELAGEEAMFREILSFVNEGDFIKACGLADAAKDKLVARETGYLRERAVDTLTEVEELLSEIGELGLETEEVEKFLGEARTFFEWKDYVQSEEVASSARESALGLKDRYRMQQTRELLRSKEEKMDEGDALGIDTGEMREILSEGYGLVEEKRYDEAELIAGRSMEMYKTAYAKYQHEHVASTLQGAQELMTRAGELGLDTVSIETLLAYAQIHFEDDEFDSAQELIEQSAATLNDMILAHELDGVKKETANIEPLMREANELSVDVSEERVSLSALEGLKEERRFDEMIALVGSVSDSLESKIRAHKKEMNTKLLRDARGELDRLTEETGQEHVEFASILGSASESLDLCDYESMKEHLALFKGSLSQHRITLLAADLNARIDGIAMEIDSIREADLDVDFALDLLDSARGKIADNEFNEAEEFLLKLADELREIRSVTAKDEAKRRATSAMETFNQLKGFGLELTEENRMFLEVKGALTEQRFVDACRVLTDVKRKVDETRENYLVEQATMVLEAVRESMEDARELSIDMIDVEGTFLEMQAAYEEGLYESAWQRGGSVKSEIETMVSEEWSRRVKGELDSLAPPIEEANNISIDISQELAELSRIEDLRSRGEYADAMEAVPILRDSIGARIEEEYRRMNTEKVVSATEALTAIEETTGEEYGDLRSTLEMATNALEGGDYGTVEGLLLEFYSLRDDHEKAFMGDSYSRQLEDSEQELGKYAGIGIEMAEAGEMVEGIRERLAGGEMDGIKEDMARLNGIISDIGGEKAKEIARELFNTTKEMITEARELGLDLSGTDDLFREAVDTIKGKEFLSGCELLGRLRGMVKTALDDHYRDDADRYLAETDEKVREAQELQLSVDEILDLVEESRNLFVDEEFRSSREKAELAMSRLVSMMKERLEEELGVKAQELNSTVGEANESGVDIANELEQLKSLGPLREEGKFREAIDLVVKVRDSITAKVTESYRVLNAKKVEIAFTDLSEFAEMAGEELGDLRDQAELAHNALKNEDYREMETHLAAFHTMKEEHNNRLLGQRYLKDLGRFSIEMERLKEADFDVSPGEEMLESAKVLVSNNEFDRMPMVIQDIGAFVEDLRDLKAKERAKELLTATKELVMNARNMGVDVGPDNEIFSEVLEAVRARDFVSACSAATSVKARLTGSMGDRLKDDSVRLLDGINEKLEEARELGLEVGPVEALIGNAHFEFGDGNHEVSLNMAREAETNLDDLFDSHYREEYENTVGEAEAVLAEARALDLEVSEQERILQDAREKHHGNQFKEASILVIDARGSLKTMRDGFLRERAAKALEMARGGLGRCEVFGLDVAWAAETLDDADMKLEEGSFDEAYEMAERTGKALTEAETQHLKKDTSSLISAVWTMMGDASELDVDMAPIEERLAQAQESLKAGNFDEAYNLAAASRTELMEMLDVANLEKYDTLAGEFEGLVEEARLSEKGLEETRTAREEIENLRDQGNYGEAVARFTVLKDLIVSKMDLAQRESRAGKIEDIIADIGGMEGTLGRELPDLRELMENCQECLKVGNDDTFNDLIMQYEEKMGRYRAEARARDFDGELAELEDSITTLEELGLEMAKSWELLVTARRSAAGGNIEALQSAISEVSGMVEHARGVEAKELAKQHIIETKQLFGEIKAKGIDTTEEDQLFQKIVGAVKKQDFIGAIGFTREAKASLTKKREKSFMEEVMELLSETRVLLGEGGALGLDVGMIEDMLSEGQDNFERGDFTRAAEIARESREMFLSLKENHFREKASSVLGAVQELMVEEMSLDVDMVAVEDMVANSRRYFNGEDFQGALGLAEEARDLLLEAQDRYSTQNASQEVENARSTMDEARKLGIDVSSAEGELAEAEKYFAEGGYKEAREIGKRINEEIRKNLDTDLMEKIRAEMGPLSPLMDEGKALNLDIRDEVDNLSKVEELKEKHKYYEAMSVVKGIQTSISNKIHLHRRQVGGDVFSQATRDIEALEKDNGEMPDSDIDLMELKESYDSASTALEEGNMEGMEVFLKEFNLIKKEIETKLLSEVYPGEFERLGHEIVAIQEIGITLAVAEELVNGGKDHITSGELERARELRVQIVEIIDDAKGVPAREIAKAHITSLKTMFNELKDRDLDLSEEEVMFREVLGSLKKEDFVGGTRLMLIVKEKLSGRRVGHFTGTVTETLSEVDAIVRKASKKKLDIRESRRLAFEARALLKRKKYEKAYELALKAKDLVLSVWDKSMEESAWLALEEIKVLIRETDVEINRESINELLAEAQKMNEEGRFSACLERIEDIKRKHRELSEETLMEAATERLTRTMDFLTIAEDASLPTDELSEEIAKAQASFDSGNFRDTIEIVDSIEQRYATLRLEQARENVSGQLKELETLLAEMSSREYFTDEYRDRIREKVGVVVSFFDRGEFIVAEERLTEVRELAEGINARMKLEDEFLDLSTSSEELIKRARENAISIEDEEDSYERAVEMKVSGELEGAITLLMETHEALISSVGDLLREKSESAFAEVLRAIGERRESFDVSHLEEKVSQARNCFKEGNYEGCMTLSSEIQEAMVEMDEEKRILDVKEYIETVRQELETNREMGLDIFDLEAYLFKATSAFEEKDYSRARELAEKAYGSALDKREGIDEGKIRILLRNTEMLLLDAAEFNIDAGIVEGGLAEAESALNERRLEDAKELTEKMSEYLREIIDTKLIEVLPQRLQDIREMLEEAKKAEADVEEEEMRLIPIDTLRAEGRYLSAMKRVAGIQESIAAKIRGRRSDAAKSRLDTAFEDFNEFKDLTGRDYPDLEFILDDSLRSSTEGDTDRMNELIEEFYEKKEEHDRQLLKETYRRRISKLEKRLTPIGETDIDIGSGEDMVDRAGEQLEEGLFDDLRATLSELDTFIDSVYSDKIRPDIDKNIKEIDRLMDRLKEKNIEVAEEENIFSTILTAMDDDDLLGAYDISSRLKNSVQQLWGHRRKDMLLEQLEDAETFYEELESKEFFSEHIKEIMSGVLEELRDHYESDEFDLMEEKFEILDASMSDMKEKMAARSGMEKLIEDSKKYRETGEGLAAGIDDEIKKLEEADARIEKEEYEEAKAILEVAIKSMKKKINKRRMAIAKMVLEDALDTFNEKKGKIDPKIAEEAQAMLKESTLEYKKGKFERAIKIAKELKEKVDSAEIEEPPEEPEKKEEEPEKEKEEKKEAPEEKKEAPPAGKKVKLTCPSCKKSYVARIAEVPAVVVCPYCGSKGVIKNL